MTSLKECRICLSFSKLYIPLMEIQNCFIYLKYMDKEFKIIYPQKVPFIMKYYNPFTKILTTLPIAILLPKGKKFRRIAKGEIQIYKKYFYSNNFSFEKWIYLSLNKKQTIEENFNTDIINTQISIGQIFISAKLIDPPSKTLDGKKNIEQEQNMLIHNSLKNIKQEKESITASTTTEKYRSVVDESNATLRRIKSGNNLNNSFFNLYSQFDEIVKDNYSNISLSELGNNEEEITSEYNNFLITSKDIYKKIKESDIKLKIPTTIEKKREMYHYMFKNIEEISKLYINSINEIKKTNEQIRKKAHEYYSQYLQQKELFNSQRKDLDMKKTTLKENIKNIKIINNEILKEAKKEQNHLNNISSQYVNSTTILDNDISIMLDILTTLKQNNVDICKGLTESDKNNLNEILIKRTNILNPNRFEASHFISLHDSDIIISIIENVVNFLFNLKQIPKIRIEQIGTYCYKFNNVVQFISFSDESKTSLKVKSGKDFDKWIVETFG